MHPCAAYLNEVQEVMRNEQAALAAEDLDLLEQLADQRHTLLKKAWDARAGYDESQLLNHLLEVEKLQQGLREKAQELQVDLRRRMNDGNKQARYFDGDRHIHSQLKKSLYCDTAT